MPTCPDFADAFQKNMAALGMPEPTCLFGSVQTATANLAGMLKAFKAVGASATMQRVQRGKQHEMDDRQTRARRRALACAAGAWVLLHYSGEWRFPVVTLVAVLCFYIDSRRLRALLRQHNIDPRSTRRLV